jgi:hypothetical protein
VVQRESDRTSRSRVAGAGDMRHSLALKMEAYVSLKRLAVSELHSIATQKTLLFIAATVRTPHYVSFQ